MNIAVLLSGGVDSSVALRLLQEQGHELTAFYVKIWLEDELTHLGTCPWEEDLKYATAVCKQLDVPLRIISLQREYWKEVVTYTIAELKAGRTPNPDVLCNQRIKFGKFIKKIGPNFDKIASGHYAQITKKGGKFYLKKSPDPIKDQTYFLAYLDQKQLAKILFPVGKYTKKEVRTLAQKFNLPNQNRKDSQGICFLGKIKFRDFVSHHLGRKKGNFIDVGSGQKCGEHDGYWYYTIGQRHGIHLSGGPWYVVKKEVKKNIVYIGKKEDLPADSTSFFNVENINWISEKSPTKRNLQVRIRHGGELYKARVVFLRGGSAEVSLKKNSGGLAPGQFAVFYDGAVCLGGGVMSI